MPQITKIRIVNFIYDDNKVLIPDELFDLTSADTGKALNTLFDCKNAGGKSILTQLIMQPVNPKAQADKRRIENFFVNGGQHSYVVLEWALDNSTEKLLTGISIATSTSAGTSSSTSSDDKTRGNSIKYYTFTTRYESFSAYNISSLELSSNVNGKYVPASYDYIRNLAKSSKGILTVYSSDESRKWAEYLAEYSIYRDEWENVIEFVNKGEGGLRGLFEGTQHEPGIETSNRLIKKLLIPTIDKKINGSEFKGSDSSLETILINYSKKITDKDNVITQRNTNIKLLVELENLNKTSDELYNANSSYLTSVTKTKGFGMAVNYRKKEIVSDKDSINQKKEEQKALLTHIRHEKLSKDYYNAIDEHDKVQADENEALLLLNESKKAVRVKRHEEEVLQCAKLYRNIQKENNTIAEIKRLIEDKENNSEDADRIACLKYSAFVKTKEAEDIQNDRKTELEKKKTEKTANISDCEKTKKKSEEAFKKAETKYQQASSGLDEAMRNTDLRIKSLNIEATRKFTGFYSDVDLDNEKTVKLKEKEEQENALSIIEKRIDEINERNSKIPQEIFILQNDQKEISQLKDKTIESIKQYDALFERISKICEKYSYESTVAFTDVLRDVIRCDIEKTEADIKAKGHKLEGLNEKKTAAESGYLHILPEIMSYVSSTGINVTTGEEYICNQIEAGTISSDKANEILRTYPELAYSLLFSNDKDIQKLLTAGNIEWLPAAVPLFTMTQIVKILDGTLDTSAYLTALDISFFNDRNGYIDKLNRDINSIKVRIEQLSVCIKEEEEELSIAEQFTYEEDWKKVQEEKIDSCNTQICDIESRIKELNTEKQTLHSELTALKEKKKKCDSSINTVDMWLSSFNELSAMQKNEQVKYKEKQDLYVVMKNASSDYDKICALLERQNKELDSIITELKNVNSIIRDIQSIIQDVDNAKTATLLEGDYQVLYNQYQTHQRNMSENLKGLRSNLDSLQREKQENENALASYECSKNEYSNPSLVIDTLTNVMQQIKELEVIRDTKQKEYTDVNGRLSALKAKVEHSKEALEDYNGVALDKGEIGDNFKERTSTAKNAINILSDELSKLDADERTLNNIINQMNNISEDLASVDEFKDIVLSDNPDEQWNIFRKELMLRKKEYANIKDKFTTMVHSIITEFKDSTMSEIINKLSDINAMVENDKIKGDRLFTASESISTMINSITKINSKIETDLKEITNDFEDLVTQCYQQGRRVCEGLRIIANSSKAHIFEDKKEQTQIIKIGLPAEKELSEEASKISMRNEIDKGANEIKEMISNNAERKDIVKKAKEIVSSERLLYRYILKETIPVKVFVIDLESSDSRYQQWEETFKEGKNKASGAQKFVIYFTVIAALMNYSRSATGVVDKDVKSVLLMDNPFGTITSKEFLEPMFRLAKRFNIQLINLTAITTDAVSNVHDCRIVMNRRSNGLSNVSVFTHENNDKIEHGYYKVSNRQMSLPQTQ